MKDGAHTHGHGGGGLGLVLILAAVVWVIAKAGPVIRSAVDTVGHILTVVLEVVLVTMAAVAGVAAAAGVGWCVVRVYRWHARRRAQVLLAAAMAKVQSSRSLQ